jgi:nucleoid DNA-binding protein
MNKAELADALAERTGIQRKDSRAAVEALFDPENGLIAQALQRGEKVSLTGFGTFEVRERKARTARNPRTGTTIEVPATRAAAFRAGKGLKDGVARR